VLLDTADLSQATSWTNRTRIKAVNGPLFLTVPVRRGTGPVIRDVRVGSDDRWRHKHLTSIRQAYCKARYFAEVFPPLEKMLAEALEGLAAFNGGLIQEICRYLGITTPIVWASSLGIPSANRDLRLLEICERLHATRYLSGHGARAYNNEELFRERGIEVIYSAFRHPQYPQLQGAFVEGLSAVDSLLNHGPATLQLLSNVG
jgi:hypothetical protein